MRIFYGFLVIMVSVGLFLLPVTDAAYDFRTDQNENTFFVQTTSGTVGNVTLTKAVYDNDSTTIEVTSNDSDDIPVVAGYHSSNKVVDITGLATSTNRTLTVTYDIDALGSSNAISNVIDKVSWIWLICLVCFPIAAIVYVIFGMKR